MLDFQEILTKSATDLQASSDMTIIVAAVRLPQKLRSLPRATSDQRSALINTKVKVTNK